MFRRLFQKIQIIIDAGRLVVFYTRQWWSTRRDGATYADQLFAFKPKHNKKKILILSLTNTPYSIKIEALIAATFAEKNYVPYFFTNFGFYSGKNTYQALGGRIIPQILLYLKHSLYILFTELPAVPSDARALKAFVYKGVVLGPCIFSNVCSKIHSGNINFSDTATRRLVYRYFFRSLVYYNIAKEVFDTHTFDMVIANEKGYSGNHELFQAALVNNVPFIQWVNCQEPGTLIFKRYSRHNERQHPNSLSAATWQAVQALPWTESIRTEVHAFFERGYISKDWFSYKRLIVDAQCITKEEFIKKYQLAAHKPIAVLFSHIMWDANLFYGNDLFMDGFEEWFTESAKAMAKNDSVNWLIKIHPANKFKHETEGITGEYREVQALRRVFGGSIPPHITLIMPEDNINPFALFSIIDYGITVRGTIGVEFPCFGVPVLTAGTGRYSHLGFTIDSETKEEYLGRLEQLHTIQRLNQRQQELACLHAYALFRLRPFKLTSAIEKEKTLLGRDLQITVSTLEQAIDIAALVSWAIHTTDEDIVNQDIIQKDVAHKKPGDEATERESQTLT